MMGRAAAGAFYSPFHSMWTGFSNSSSSSQKYSGNSSQNSFGYPPTPPKDSSTPDQPLSTEDNGYGGHHMNNNNVVPTNSVASDTKPSTEHLMNPISSLSAYAGLPGSSASRKLPEGTNSSSSQQYSEGSMFYYPTTSDLAMYGASSYGNKPHQCSRPKSKNRSNAGKLRKECSKLELTGDGFQLH